MKEIKCELYHDNFQNFKRYDIPKAQLFEKQPYEQLSIF